MSVVASLAEPTGEGWKEVGALAVAFGLSSFTGSSGSSA